MFATSSQRQWARTFACIKSAHDNAYRIIERAIKFEEHERPDMALTSYKEGIRAIDEALAIPVEISEDFQKDESWQSAVRMIHKMKCTRGEVLQRVGQLASKIDQRDAANDKNGMESITTEGQVLRPRTYTELAQALRDMQSGGDEVGETSSLELLFSCDGVKMYYIEPDGVVSRALEDSTLRIIRIEKDDIRKLESTVFVQVIPTVACARIENAEEPLLERGVEAREGLVVVSEIEEHREVDPSFIYPLIPGVSPCYRTEYGAFIIPDLTSENGRTIGLIIPPDADDVVLEIFVAFLHGIVTQGGGFQFGAPRPRRSTSANVSANIIKGAFYVSKGLIKGAEKTGEFIAYSTPYIISKIRKTPDEAPAQVPGNVKTGIEIAKSVSGTAANVTSYVAGKVGTATMALGRFLAPHIQKHGSNLLSYSTGMSAEDASDKVQGALTVCAGAVEGFGTVYDGLEKSASILGASLSNSTVQIVQHKYGSEAGQVVGSSLDTVGNVINVSHNMNYITPKGIAKRTAKNAGKALVAGYRPPIPEVDLIAGEGSSSGHIMEPQQRVVPAAVLYPDLSGLAEEVRK
ncbi:protein spartin [Wyeomyia smithii]|uniref:protein spartin n=1 Tax=Wyeomyia smithii TaxID=174621 RepID=UPI002467F8C9|nr:protein spartin [Wyeomyia smithii]XP_055540904.1 protein spartin [Wyeomyia smithii]XP_055540905.1 protein spartin [Wyeomyia smithii]XP_055540906.1 protein spartin [Wyeomyia smithii]XP_055540907.1 protein spartin [Wyeomyia smithii]XP_055540908.1 protein spartin [Wyeomyia smithii]XP_055540909.1 protein spartin [Wyeomyia smithii]